MNNDDKIERGDPIREKDLQTNAVPLDRAYERENYEPAELENPLPKWYAAMSLALVVWGAVYFYQQGVVPADAGDSRSVMALASGAADGATVYAGNCVACHQGNGLGIAGAFPPLDGSGWVNAEPELLVQILLHGVQGEMEVLGNVYNGVMPAMAHLSDEELAAVSTYIRTSWSNASGEIDAALVAEQRERFDPARGPWVGGAELKAEVGEPLDAAAAGS